MTVDVGANYSAIRTRIEAACGRSGRKPHHVTLVGACKRQPLDRLASAHAAGLRAFGENIVQEALAHREALPADIEWHLIGPLQSNKVTKAVTLFSWVHSVDRLKIARALDRAARQKGLLIHGLLEVNLGKEESKHGFAISGLEAVVEELEAMTHLRIEGLMAIPPFEDDPEASRPWFRRLRELRDRLFARPALGDRPGHLSMGMSSDFEIAIEEGASHVRIGTDLFGPRESR